MKILGAQGTEQRQIQEWDRGRESLGRAGQCRGLLLDAEGEWGRATCFWGLGAAPSSGLPFCFTPEIRVWPRFLCVPWDAGGV